MGKIYYFDMKCNQDNYILETNELLSCLSSLKIKSCNLIGAQASVAKCLEGNISIHKLLSLIVDGTQTLLH